MPAPQPHLTPLAERTPLLGADSLPPGSLFKERVDPPVHRPGIRHFGHASMIHAGPSTIKHIAGVLPSSRTPAP
jgi:hypothetical protein